MSGKKGMRDKLLSSPVIAEKFRQSIRVALIRNRLVKHILGEIEMSTTQIRAAEILLNKCIPNLGSVEHKGEINHNYVAMMPQVSKSSEEWTAEHAPTLQ